MRKVLDEAKKCYAEEVDDQLIEQMLVIDGCFILELLYVNYHGKPNDGIDPILDSILMPIYVRHDLLLLESQLPFFVLNKLFDLTVAHIAGARQGTLTDYVIPYFGNMWDSGNNRTTLPLPPPPKNNEYCHILHILHNHYAKPQEQNPGSLVMPCASDLDYAGVKFRVGTEVRFQNPEGPFDRAYFEIPKLKLYDSSEPFLRNLIAFEQCCHGDVIKRYFASYAVLLDTLINTHKDVQVLERAKIIDNYCVSDFLTTLSTQYSSGKHWQNR
ncbi:UPF0481 protein At3g47200-like [Camellia sinensis]|uniref:UPF0481 protein At3g47200-like n=1 Tax=Camellia sinensis TaxID=4442 RepID=UPI00103652F9|nr:UPF0481 protein At3g47200-like [Camellia sinensis]